MINPYDRYITNKMMNGMHCTIVCYVDDNKLSNMKSRTVTGILEIMIFLGGVWQLIEVKVHIFLGINITTTADKTIMVEMEDQMMETIEIFSFKD